MVEALVVPSNCQSWRDLSSRVRIPSEATIQLTGTFPISVEGREAPVVTVAGLRPEFGRQCGAEILLLVTVTVTDIDTDIEIVARLIVQFGIPGIETSRVCQDTWKIGTSLHLYVGAIHSRVSLIWTWVFVCWLTEQKRMGEKRRFVEKMGLFVREPLSWNWRYFPKWFYWHLHRWCTIQIQYFLDSGWVSTASKI